MAFCDVNEEVISFHNLEISYLVVGMPDLLEALQLKVSTSYSVHVHSS